MELFYQTLTHLEHVSAAQRQAMEARHRDEQAKLLETMIRLDCPSIPAFGSTLDDSYKSAPRTSSYPPNHDFGTPITFTVNMVLDPRIAAGTSRQAIDHFERAESFTMRSVCHGSSISTRLAAPYGMVHCRRMI